jgi:hypothetical protein
VAASRKGRTRETETEGGGVEVDDDGGEVDVNELEEEDGGGVRRVGDEAVVRSEAKVKTVMRSKAWDEAAARSKVRIEDGGWRQHNGV